MIVAPYSQDYIDIFTKNVIAQIKKTIGGKDDDFLLTIVGTTGTGKSSLSLHLYELFDEQGCSVEFIGLDQKDFATAVQNAKNKEQPRFCCYDEANVNRSAHASNWNKDLEDLYLSIRGLQIFHVWNNPSAQKFPRTFIEERMKGMIYIFTKDKDRPRLFYYFTKKGMLDLYDECKGKMSHQNFSKLGKKYAKFRGWFKDYDGKLLNDYRNKKSSRMDVKVDDFFSKYASEDVLTITQVAKQFGVHQNTIARWFAKLGSDLVEGEDYIVNAAGHKRFGRSGIEKLKNHGSKASENVASAGITPLYKDARKEKTPGEEY